MCLGIPGQVVEILPGDADLAIVNVSGVKRHINIGLLNQTSWGGPRALSP
jgi:hydrogenase expression/formation protein HypC